MPRLMIAYAWRDSFSRRDQRFAAVFIAAASLSFCYCVVSMPWWLCLCDRGRPRRLEAVISQRICVQWNSILQVTCYSAVQN